MLGVPRSALALAWVTALVDRYDSDGVDDMPGLVRPVRHWVVGGEWTGFWPNDEDDAAGYIRTLELTADAARAAYPEVHLGTIPSTPVFVLGS